MEDYKQKYEQALERCKKEFNFNNLAYSHEEIKQRLERVFPELKESEDERIRKELIEFVKSRGGFKQEYIAWLEKQGEKVDVIENFDTEFEKQVSHLIASTINKEHEYNKGFVKWTANTLLNYAKHELEKQGESCYPYQPGWRKNYSGNKPKVKHSVLMLTTHGIAEGEWLGEEWCQYRWSCKVKDTEVLYWMHLSDLENLEKENEKQGEQKPTNKCIGCNNFKGCITCTDGDQYAHITEQKPTDKVKPKFHEGEWITNGDYTWKIVEVKPLDYILQSQDGNIVDDTISHVDEQFHSFTIKDAKDGDVLSFSDDAIIIFKNLYNNSSFHAYCYIEGGVFDINAISTTTPSWWDSNGFVPATKEQRDLLFTKMKEAGYEWDAEKKELKKIEQKPAWSEEDEQMLTKAISAVKYACFDSSSIILWLKSIKERMKGECISVTDEELAQAKKDAYNDALDKIEYHSGEPTFDDGWSAAIWYLKKKNAQPQSTWKPSDEQIRELGIVATGMGWFNKEVLSGLLEQLKKLREE